jgi:hypothetical protein
MTDHIPLSVHILLSLMGTLWLMAGLEWSLHRYLMHRRWLGKVTGNAYLKRQFSDHAIWHHHRYYRFYDDEPDEIGRWHNLDISVLSGVLLCAPFCMGMYFLDPLTAYMIFAAGILQPLVWTEFHTEMHIPSDVWWSRNIVYRSVRYHHLLHHLHPDKNFGGLLPVFDWICRTSVKPTAADHEKLRSRLRHDSLVHPSSLEMWLRDR